MTSFKRVFTTKAGISAIPSTQGVKFGGLVYTSGIGPLKPGGSEVETGPFRDQMIQTVSNIRAILIAGGSDLQYCVQVIGMLRSSDLLEEYNAIYREIVPEPFPPRMTFITELVHPAILIEMPTPYPRRSCSAPSRMCRWSRRPPSRASAGW